MCKLTRLNIVLILAVIVGCGEKDVTPGPWPFTLDASDVRQVTCTLGTEEIGTAEVEIKSGQELQVRVVCKANNLFESSGITVPDNSANTDMRPFPSQKSWQLFAIVAGIKGTDSTAVVYEMTPMTGKVSGDRRTLEFVGDLRLPKSSGTYDFRLILFKFGTSIEFNKPLPIERGILRTTIRLKNRS